jgi:hypothetical protein
MYYCLELFYTDIQLCCLWNRYLGGVTVSIMGSKDREYDAPRHMNCLMRPDVLGFNRHHPVDRPASPVRPLLSVDNTLYILEYTTILSV